MIWFFKPPGVCLDDIINIFEELKILTFLVASIKHVLFVNYFVWLK